MPVGAFGGKADIMKHIAPSGPVYQAGTLSGNPVAMAAGMASLKLVQTPELYDKLSHQTEKLALGFKAIADKHEIPLSVNYAGSMFGIFFTEVPRVVNYHQAINCNTQRFNQFHT